MLYRSTSFLENSLKDYVSKFVPWPPKKKMVETETQSFVFECAEGGKSPASRQYVEKGQFEFDYQGEAYGSEFELLRMVSKHIRVGDRKWMQTVGISVPICNEYAPSDRAFVDWLNFTFNRNYYTAELEDDVVIGCLSRDLEAILGYGVTLERSAGLNGYATSYVLGNEFGFVCIGGHSQKDTVLVIINGTGCEQAALERPNWQGEIKQWGMQVDGFRITRTDLAHDYLAGEYTVDEAVRDYDKGLFNCGGRTPAIEQRGDWRTHNNENGRTVVIGRRKSGKVCRIYEKGKQLGKKDSPWVRVECEWHNTNRYIPLDILTEPGRYLAGAYPALFAIAKHVLPERIKTLVKKMVYDEAVSTARHQIGTIIWLMNQVEKDAESIINKLIRAPVSLFNRYALLAERMGKLGIEPSTG